MGPQLVLPQSYFIHVYSRRSKPQVSKGQEGRGAIALVTKDFGMYTNPTSISGTDYAHHIIMPPT